MADEPRASEELDAANAAADQDFADTDAGGAVQKCAAVAKRGLAAARRGARATRAWIGEKYEEARNSELARHAGYVKESASWATPAWVTDYFTRAYILEVIDKIAGKDDEEQPPGGEPAD